MPGIDGKLTARDQTLIHDWIRAHWKHKGCPICGTFDQWLWGGDILTDELSDGTVPYVVFFCRTCAYSVRFNAVMMGLYAPIDAPALQIMPATPSTSLPIRETHRGS
jgi:hypothetical protein